LGISHGALDHVKGKKLLKLFNYNSITVFYFSYIFIGITIIFIWLLFPKILLLTFLVVAAFHFGKEDCEFIYNKTKLNIIYFFKGSLVITAPLLFHKTETLEIFNILNFEISENILISNEFLYLFLLISLFAHIIISINKHIDVKSLLLMDFISILLINYFLNPILAFAIYFCFLHSIRHSFKLSNELNKTNFIKGFKEFFVKALPLTILTAILFLISLFFLNNYLVFDSAISKVIFIGLASLTFPHILLEYLIEKYE
jgi:Brp/Blh family beta-carotene 15,15'-monooxygenase